MIRSILVGIQAATFLLLAIAIYHDGNWRLAAAQVLLGVVTGLVYI